MEKLESTEPLLDKKYNTRIQQVSGKLLFYARAIDNNLLMGLNTIASQQENAMTRTSALLTHLLNFCATYPDAILTFNASDMILHIHTYASFLSKPKAKIRAGGYFFLSDFPDDPTKAMHNAPIYLLCQILKNVLASASEAELAAMFENAQMGAIIRATLWDLGHKQPPKPLQTDNTTAAGIIHNTFKQVRSRTVDMRFHWIRDRSNIGHFYVYWDKGENNYGDYYTKQHPP